MAQAGAQMKIGRLILIEVLVVVLLAIIGLGGYYFYWQGQDYISTDDAALSGNLVTVVALAPGQITGQLPAVGSRVPSGGTLFDENVASSAASTAASSAAHAAKSRSSTLTVRVGAPAAGRVAEVSVVGGQYVQAGTPLATLVSATGNQVTAYVPENQIKSIKRGQTVDVTIDAYPGDSFPGHVVAIVPATQASLSILPSTQSSGTFTKVTQRVPVIIDFENPDGANLYTGLSVEVRVHTGS